MNGQHLEIIYARAREVQPQIENLVKAFEAQGMTHEEILLETSVALINEGYRLHELQTGVKISVPHERTLQTKIDTNTEKE